MKNHHHLHLHLLSINFDRQSIPPTAAKALGKTTVAWCGMPRHTTVGSKPYQTFILCTLYLVLGTGVYNIVRGKQPRQEEEIQHYTISLQILGI